MAHQSVCSIKHGDQHEINSIVNGMDNFASWTKRRKCMNELENFDPMETELHRLHGLLEGLGILANEYNFGNSREANAIVSNIELAIERSEALAENYEHLQIERRKQMNFIRQLAMKAQLIFEQKGRKA
jgi:serine phosphatase RsbU (regulator of sigma subunit)